MRLSFLRRLYRRDNSLEGIAKRRVKPETLENVLEALSLGGFSATVYRTTYDEFMKAIPDDRTAILHFVAHCHENTRIFPFELRLESLRKLFQTRAPQLFKAKAAVALLQSYCSPWSPLWSLSPLAQRDFWSELLIILSRVGSPYFIIGDSHSVVYQLIVRDKHRLLIPIPIFCPASSALGLSNPESRSGAGNRLAKLAASLKEIPIAADSYLFFKFGQVDIEFVFNFDRIKYGQFQFNENEFVSFCKPSVDSYIGFVSTHFERSHCVIIGVYPPALNDATWREGYVNASIVATESDQNLEEVVQGIRKLEIPSLGDRTRHHAYYNRILRASAESAQLNFLHDFPHFIGENGVLGSNFVPTHKGTDHHLEGPPTARIIGGLIADQVNRCNQY